MLFDPFEAYYTHGLLYKHLTDPHLDYFRSITNPIIRGRFWKKWQAHSGKQAFWIAMSRRFKKIDDMRDHFLAIMVTRSTKEYANLYDLECYQKWVGRLHTMHVQFEDDLILIRRRAGSLKKSLRAEGDGQPMLYTLLMSRQVSMETFAWLVHFQPKIITVMDAFFDPLDLAWKEKRMIAMKYSTFLTRLNINQERLKTILKGYIV